MDKRIFEYQVLLETSIPEEKLSDEKLIKAISDFYKNNLPGCDLNIVSSSCGIIHKEEQLIDNQLYLSPVSQNSVHDDFDKIISTTKDMSREEYDQLFEESKGD